MSWRHALAQKKVSWARGLLAGLKGDAMPVAGYGFEPPADLLAELRRVREWGKATLVNGG